MDQSILDNSYFHIPLFMYKVYIVGSCLNQLTKGILMSTFKKTKITKKRKRKKGNILKKAIRHCSYSIVFKLWHCGGDNSVKMLCLPLTSEFYSWSKEFPSIGQLLFFYSRPFTGGTRFAGKQTEVRKCLLPTKTA